jgi:lipopolysaccharide/colanic/teichoic acid biosynthesis glycosyltransferase
MPSTFYARLGKRLLDVVLSAIGLIVMSPVLLVVAITIKLTSPGPVFFRQVRVGLGGRSFQILKFRSMRIDAEKLGLGITSSGDSRITRIGALLRKTKLDEFPQLWNVLIGTMSIIGPRPELPKYVDLYNDLQRQALLVRPGISSIASVRFRNEEELLAQADDKEDFYIHVLIEAKNALDRQYVREISLVTDLRIVFETVAAVSTNHGNVDLQHLVDQYWISRKKSVDV